MTESLTQAMTDAGIDYDTALDGSLVVSGPYGLLLVIDDVQGNGVDVVIYDKDNKLLDNDRFDSATAAANAVAELLSH